MRNLSITIKITIWYTVFMLLITGCFLGVLVYTGNQRATEMAKTKLMDEVTDASEEVERFGGNFVVDDKLKFYDDGVYISVYDGEGELVEGRRPGELSQLMPQFDDETVTKVRDDAGEVWYTYDRLFEVDNQFVWIRGVVKDFAEQSTFSFVRRLAVIALPGLVLVAALGGYMIARSGFYPIRSIIATVKDIREDGDLSRRVAIDNEENGDEIHKLATTFNEMFDKLEASFETEKQFTSDVSHELRTPLAVIISQSDYAKEDEGYRGNALETINKEAKRMSALVNRLLTLSRSDAGRLKLNLENIDLTEMCEMVVQQQETMAADKNITVESDVMNGITIKGDDSMIIRILLNLMDNAIKYGKEGGNIKLSLKKNDSYAVCSVKDDGIGIAEEDIKKIWERFYRVDASRSEDGVGLGLSMVDALVKAHGGHTEVTSVLGEGSCFSVYFPLADEDVEDKI